MLAPLALLACTATPAGPAVSLTSAAPDRPTVSLDGDWEFILDPQREGWAAGWSSGRHALPHTCEVPGAWEAQGFGNETAHLWRSFQPTNETLASLYPALGLPGIPVGGPYAANRSCQPARVLCRSGYRSRCRRVHW